MAYQTGNIELQSKVHIRFTKMVNGEKHMEILHTTAGRVLFNQAIPQDLGIVNRDDPANEFALEIDAVADKKQLGKIVDYCFRKHGPTKTSEVLDIIKRQGFHYSTLGAITISVSDIMIPKEKEQLLAEAETEVVGIQNQFKRGLLTEEERKASVINVWKDTTDRVTEKMITSLDKFNPISMMADSGARGSKNQIRQLAGMRGLMADPNGETIEIPIRANFREGLTVLEFFISTHGARKGLADTALRTADSGYLTRRLVDVSQEVIIREDDCFASVGVAVRGTKVMDVKNGNEIVEPLVNRLRGRYTVDAVIHPETGAEMIGANQLINDQMAEAIVNAGITSVNIRSVLTCQSEKGVCAKCYGANMSTGTQVNIGEAVGIIAAQSIGEPGTQLTMRTFHTGGVAGGDITQGLPRVEELFEARKPKGLAIITDISGTTTVNDAKRKREILVADDNGNAESYSIPFGARIKVRTGDVLEAGDELTEGSINPNDILKIKGIQGVQAYLLKEVQKVYRLQGVEIADKHIEIIIRQMLKKCKIEESGDTEMLPGSLVDIFAFDKENKAATEAGNEPATAKRVLLGITKASLATDSFLSAASFQETTRVLTEAAIKGKVDPLVGLKENVIIGKLIPAGTGMKQYRDIEVIKNKSSLSEEIAGMFEDDLDVTDIEI